MFPPQKKKKKKIQNYPVSELCFHGRHSIFCSFSFCLSFCLSVFLSFCLSSFVSGILFAGICHRFCDFDFFRSCLSENVFTSDLYHQHLCMQAEAYHTAYRKKRKKKARDVCLLANLDLYLRRPACNVQIIPYLWFQMRLFSVCKALSRDALV